MQRLLIPTAVLLASMFPVAASSQSLQVCPEQKEGMTSETRERLKALERENRDQRIHQLSTPLSENRAGPAE